MSRPRGSPRRGNMARGRDERGGIHSGYGGYRNYSDSETDTGRQRSLGSHLSPPKNVTVYQSRDTRRRIFRDSDDVRLSPGSRGAAGGDQGDSGSETEIYYCAGQPGKNCGKIIRDEEDSIMCDMCLKWFHINCQSVSRAMFNAFSEKDAPPYICKQCNGKKGGLHKTHKGQEILFEVEERFRNMDGRISGIEDRVDDLEVKTDYAANDEFKAAVDEKINEFKSEFEDQQFRKPNIIVEGIPESSKPNGEDKKKDDMDMVKKLLNVCEMSDAQVKVAVRVGPSKNGGPRSLKVVFKDEAAKLNILTKEVHEKMVANDNFKDIMIYPDRTPKEREVIKQLVVEKKAKNAELRAKGLLDRKYIISRYTKKLVEIKLTQQE